ncbi:MAG TPA: hypothetical protein VHF89_19390 [Solirubrobacteraceae bacterium]|nr:hypothetical protein [Solirubrobacteraceae bacterium]
MTRTTITTLAAAVIGALLVITTFAFGGDAADWISFGLAVAALGTAGALRGQRLLGAGIGLVSAWTILVALGIFSGATQTWLIFAGGAAIGTAGVIGNALSARRQTAVAEVRDLKAA